jgi:hypothetical protein
MPSLEVERVSQPRGDRVRSRTQGSKREASSSPDGDDPPGKLPMGNASEATREPLSHVTSETQAALGPQWTRCQGRRASHVAKAARSTSVQSPSTAPPADSGTRKGASHATQGRGKPLHALTYVRRPTHTRTREAAGIFPRSHSPRADEGDAHRGTVLIDERVLTEREKVMNHEARHR